MSDAARLALALLLAAGLAACGPPEPYQTEDGDPSRIDGTEASVDSMTIAQAQASGVPSVAYVQGYLLVPVDDVSRLCTRLPQEGPTCGAPSLVLDNSHDDLRRLGAPVLEHGCCAIGDWTPRPVVLHLWLRPGRRAHVLG